VAGRWVSQLTRKLTAINASRPLNDTAASRNKTIGSSCLQSRTYSKFAFKWALQRTRLHTMLLSQGLWHARDVWPDLGILNVAAISRQFLGGTGNFSTH
jgi:hypothetical protein